MGMFQKVNDWLADKGEKLVRGGDAGKAPGGAYYASNEAQQAYGGMRAPVTDAPTTADGRGVGGDTGRIAPVDRFSADSADKYNGRVPYRSQKDMQAEADAQRQQAEDQSRRQQTAQQRQAQPFGRAPAPQAAYTQPAQQPSNVLPFPGLVRGPEGNLYAHVEYVVLLRSRNECTKVIEYIKSNASVFLNMEFIANDSERQRCVDMLSGAAYTLGCHLNKISQRGIYLISSPSVYVVIDPAMQKYASAPEAQGYVRPEYAAYGGYGSQTGYAAPRPAYAGQGGYQQPAASVAPAAAGYTAGARGAYATQTTGTYPQQGANVASYAAGGARSGYAAQTTGTYPQQGASAAAGDASANAGFAAVGPRTAAYAGRSAGGAQQPGGNVGGYAAPSGGNTAPFDAVSATGYGTASAATGRYDRPAAYAAPGAATGAYAAQSAAGFRTGNFAGQPAGGAQAQPSGFGINARGTAQPFGQSVATGAFADAAGTQPRRATAPFGMQGAFTRSADNAVEK